MPSKSFQFFAIAHSPQFHSLVTTGRGKGLPVWTETHTPDHFFMSYQGCQLFAVNTPQFYSTVITGRGKGLPVWTKTHTPDIITSMPPQSCQQRVVKLPQCHCLISTSRGNGLTIGTETHGINGIAIHQAF